MMFSLPLPAACLDSSRGSGGHGYEDNTCSQDSDFGSLPEALRIARDTSEHNHVLANFDGKAAAVHKLPNGQSLVSLVNVRQRHQLQV